MFEEYPSFPKLDSFYQHYNSCKTFLWWRESYVHCTASNFSYLLNSIQFLSKKNLYQFCRISLPPLLSYAGSVNSTAMEKAFTFAIHLHPNPYSKRLVIFLVIYSFPHVEVYNHAHIYIKCKSTSHLFRLTGPTALRMSLLLPSNNDP